MSSFYKAIVLSAVLLGFFYFGSADVLAGCEYYYQGSSCAYGDNITYACSLTQCWDTDCGDEACIVTGEDASGGIAFYDCSAAGCYWHTYSCDYNSCVGNGGGGGGGGGGCTPPPQISDPGPQCESLGTPNYGLYARYYEETNLVGVDYTCGPSTQRNETTCGWWDATWDGYFIAPTTGEYQFWLQGQPLVQMQLDVNGNDNFDQTCPGMLSGGARFGDRFYFLQADCEKKYRAKPIRRETSSGYIDPNADCGDEGCSCKVGGEWCAVGRHCEVVDMNTLDDPYKDNLFDYRNYDTPGSQQGSNECPVNWSYLKAPDPDELDNPNRKGTANIWFKRTLTAGAHKVQVKYTYNRGSTPDSTSHKLKLLYRKPGTENWINLSSLDDNSSCPFVPKNNCAEPSCNLSLTPVTANVIIGGTAVLTAGLSNVQNGSVSSVTFTSSNTLKATVSPPSDDSSPYQTTARGVAPETATITASAIMNGLPRCSDTSVINITSPSSWFQTVGASLHANGGSVSSQIPASCSGSCLPYLILEDANAQTGAVSYTGSVSLGAYPLDNVSENARDWRLNTVYQGVTTGYDYFYRLLSEDPSGLKEWNGSLPTTNGVYLGDGITETSAGNWNVPSGRKIVILAPNDLVIKNTVINVASGASGGFLAIISSGNITMADNVTRIEGVYLADGTINSCQSASCSQQLNGEGIFVGWAGIDLRRDLGAGNGSAPAELFTYRPDLVVNAYRYLLRPHYSWREVAP